MKFAVFISDLFKWLKNISNILDTEYDAINITYAQLGITYLINDMISLIISLQNM